MIQLMRTSLRHFLDIEIDNWNLDYIKKNLPLYIEDVISDVKFLF